MTERHALTERVALQQIDERVRAARRPQVPAPRRPRTRHRLASRLHALADRLDG
jgi:hypothetical protein